MIMKILQWLFLFIAFFCLSTYSFVYLPKDSLSLRGKVNRSIACMLLAVGIVYAGTSHSNGSSSIVNDLAEETQELFLNEKENDIATVGEAGYLKLDVPLLNQLDEPQLYNGCEVTSLAMVLNYYGINVSKNELAEKISKVPFENEDGLHGDPNEGFVGDITGETDSGYGVYVEPIIALAKNYLTSQYAVIDLTGKTFEEVLLQLSLGTPIWCITTVPMAATDDMEIWQTPNGEVEISWNIHSVVLTGYDQDQVFVNDPYGEKTQVAEQDFKESWEQMGSQAMAIYFEG